MQENKRILIFNGDVYNLAFIQHNQIMRLINSII